MSSVTAIPATHPDTARRFFEARLAAETDAADVGAALRDGTADFTVVDCRSRASFAAGHIPGAISLPHRTISERTTAGLWRYRVLVVYGWRPACDAATKAAGRLAALGFRVKEMIGGLEYWRREGYAVEGTLGDAAPLVG